MARQRRQTVILDTNIVIDFLKGREPVASIFAGLRKKHRLALTTISVYELSYGAIASNMLGTVTSFASSLHILTFDAEAAYLAAVLDRELSDKGQRIEAADIFIAAIALSKSLPLVTKNVKHFGRIGKLALIDPTQATTKSAGSGTSASL